MPKVPTYDNFQVTPAAGPKTAQQFDTPKFDNAGNKLAEKLGENALALGKAGAKLEIDALEEANKVRVNDAVNQAIDQRIKLTFDEDGFTRARGEAALNRPDGKSLPDEYGDKFQQSISKIGDSLANPVQQQMFSQKASGLMIQFKQDVSRHMASEYGEHQVGVAKSTIDLGTTQMVLGWGDPAKVQESQANIRGAVAEIAKLKGWAPVQQQAATTEALSKGNFVVIKGAIDSGSLDFAKQFFDKHGADLTPESRLSASHLLETGAFEQKTQAGATGIWAQSGGDIEKALSAARDQFTGKEQDGVVLRLKTFNQERVQFREQKQKDAADTAWRVYADKGMGAIPPSVLTGMDGKDLEAIRAHAKAKSEGKSIKTDPEVYYGLAIAAAEDPDFKDLDLRRYSAKLSTEDFKSLVNKQAAVRKGGEDGIRVARTESQISALSKTLGFKNERAGQFTISAHAAITEATAANGGRPLGTKQIQEVLDDLVISTNNSVFPNTFAFQAKAKGEQFKGEGTEQQRTRARDQLKQRGITAPTDAQVTEYLQIRANSR